MTESAKVIRLLSAFALALFAPAMASANGDGIPVPLKMDVKFDAFIRIYTPPDALFKNHAPWYTYFPADPAMLTPPAGGTYPTWPGSLPPPQPQQALPQHTLPSNSGPGINAQPVGYSRSSVPSYWFAR